MTDSKLGTRAVVAQIPIGNEAMCPSCSQPVKFNAKRKPRRVICNIYVGDRWDRAEEYHESCYRACGYPHGSPTLYDPPHRVAPEADVAEA